MYSASALANVLSFFEMINKTTSATAAGSSSAASANANSSSKLESDAKSHRPPPPALNHQQLLMLAHKELQAFYGDAAASGAKLPPNPFLVSPFLKSSNHQNHHRHSP